MHTFSYTTVCTFYSIHTYIHSPDSKYTYMYREATYTYIHTYTGVLSSTLLHSIALHYYVCMYVCNVTMIDDSTTTTSTVPPLLLSPLLLLCCCCVLLFELGEVLLQRARQTASVLDDVNLINTLY